MFEFPNSHSVETKAATFIVLDIAAIVHMIRPGPRTMIGDGHTRKPKHEWNLRFLKNTENKMELFPLLSRGLVKLDQNERVIISTNIKNLLSNKDHYISSHATTL